MRGLAERRHRKYLRQFHIYFNRLLNFLAIPDIALRESCAGGAGV